MKFSDLPNIEVIRKDDIYIICKYQKSKLINKSWICCLIDDDFFFYWGKFAEVDNGIAKIEIANPSDCRKLKDGKYRYLDGYNGDINKINYLCKDCVENYLLKKDLGDIDIYSNRVQPLQPESAMSRFLLSLRSAGIAPLTARRLSECYLANPSVLRMNGNTG